MLRLAVLFSGATASVRGSANFAAFSSAMHGKRALAQSLAAELGPSGVHVAHVCIDGAVDSPFVRELASAAPGGEAAYEAAHASGGLLAPAMPVALQLQALAGVAATLQDHLVVRVARG